MGLKVPKEKRMIIAVVDRYRLEGEMYVLPRSRPLDELNKPHQFIPLTNVTIYDLKDSSLVDTVPVLFVNKNYIKMIIPLEKGK